MKNPRENYAGSLFQSYIIAVLVTFIPIISLVYFGISPDKGTLLKQLQDNFFVYGLVCAVFSGISLFLALTKDLSNREALKFGLLNGILTPIMPLAFFFVIIPIYDRMKSGR